MKISLNDLNDDCLRYIINFLNFRDQILLSQTSQRFQYLIQEEWSLRRACQKLSLSEYFWKSSKIDVYFPKFIRFISCVVGDIELDTYHLERWGPLLRKQEFPNISRCTATILQSHLNTDDQVLLITNCFPHLVKLTLRGQITGNHIWNLKHLRDLHFDVNDIKLKDVHLRQLYKTLPLKKLTLFSEDHRTSHGFVKAIDSLYFCHSIEELRIAGDIVHTTISKIKRIKSLRKITAGVLLSFRFIPYPLEDIGVHFGSEVESIIFRHVIKDRADHLKGLNNMTKLRKVILYEDSITSEQLRLISIQLCKTLEEFHYLKSRLSFEDEDSFVFLIAQCPHLKVLDVTGTPMDMSFIRDISSFLSKQKRSQLLHVRCGDTKIFESDVQNLRLPDNLKISFDKYDIELPEEYFFQVILKKGAF